MTGIRSYDVFFECRINRRCQRSRFGEAQVAGRGMPARGQGRSVRILIADDDPLSRRVLEVALGRLGHEPVVITNGTVFATEEAACVWLTPPRDDQRAPSRRGAAAEAP